MAKRTSGWSFVNIDTPDGLKDAAVRRHIRSHIAYQQHEKAGTQKKRKIQGQPQCPSAASSASASSSSSSTTSDLSPSPPPPLKRRKQWTFYTAPSDTADAVSLQQQKSMMAMRLRQRLYQQMQLAPRQRFPLFGDIISRAKNNSKVADADVQITLEILHEFFAQSTRIQKPLLETGLAGSTMRESLRQAIVISPSLFQSSLFVAGTFSNTCGMAFEDVQMGVGMLFMRGVSLQAVHSALSTATEKDFEHGSTMAMALLAGWELQFGDKESYEIHMRAWQSIFQNPRGIKASSLPLMLSDIVFEAIREQLNDASLSGFRAQPGESARTGLPEGFSVFSTTRPEAMSLFSIIRLARDYDVTTDNPPTRIRLAGLQAMAWTPHHSESTIPAPSFELAWNKMELNALYHARAATLSIISLHAHIAHSMHNAVTYLNILGAANVHAHSCQHLRTPALMGTRFAYLAIWARFTICAISPGSTPNHLLKQWLKELHIKTWVQMKVILEAHLFLDAFAVQAQTLFEELSP